MEGGRIWVDLEVNMIDGYPEACGPALKFVRKKGITVGQLSSLQRGVESRIPGLIGTEMIFDLVEEAKVKIPIHYLISLLNLAIDVVGWDCKGKG